MDIYKQKYEQALSQAEKELKCCGSLDCDAARQIFRLFPELKESEDERIGKQLLNWFKDCKWDAIDNETLKRDDIIAWLEKQGEQSKQHLHDIIIALWDLLDKIDTFSDLQIDDTNPDNPFRKIEDITQERHKFVKSDGYNLYIKGEQITDFKQDEQKPTDKVKPKFKVGDIITPKDRGHEPWQIMQVDISDKKYRFKDGCVIHFSQEDDYELVEQTPAWSEEDSKIINNVITFIEDGALYKEEKDFYIERLKSIKERYTWKPSDEQLVYLSAAIEENQWNPVLESLYNDLKKLRNE